MTTTQAATRAKLPPGFPIIWKGETGYEKARVGRVFNYRCPDRYPVAVVEATAEGHIVEAMRLAAELGCRVSVRSGGHSWAVWSVRDEAILIDLGRYHEFSFDESTGIATASPSTTGRLVNKLLEPHGRIFPGGHCPEVALGGFLLQGGMGWNCKVSVCDPWPPLLLLPVLPVLTTDRTGAGPASGSWPWTSSRQTARGCTATRARIATSTGQHVVLGQVRTGVAA